MKKDNGKTEEEMMSKLWEIEDTDYYLIVRVLYTSHPWLVIHHGVNEIAKAPLVLFVEDEDIVGNKVSLTLRDSANRGCQCIKRKFILEFHSGTDARAFQAVHNLPLQEHAEKLISYQENERKLTNAAFMKERFERGDVNNVEDDNNIETPNPVRVRDSSNQGCQCIKRLEFHSGTDARAFQAVQNLPLQEHAGRKLTNEDFMKERFERGDENNVENDNNTETQNPWDDDDYVL